MRSAVLSVLAGLLIFVSSVQARPRDIDDLDFHTYVGNDPANKADPTGKDPLQDSVQQEYADKQILEQCGNNGQCISAQEQRFAESRAAK